MQSMIGMHGMDMPAGKDEGMEGMEMPKSGEKTQPPPERPQHQH